MITRREWDRFQEALEGVETFVEDICIEVEVDGDFCVIEDLPGEAWCDPDGDEGIDIDWDFLEDFPKIADEVVYHYNLISEIEAADRYTRRAESGFADA